MKKKAFTLAEVLITLTIIGVIAAITIPNLMQKWQNEATVTKVKKGYNAITRMATNIKTNTNCNDLECTGLFGISDGTELHRKFVELAGLKDAQVKNHNWYRAMYMYCEKTACSDTSGAAFQNHIITQDGMGYIISKISRTDKPATKFIRVILITDTKKSFPKNGRTAFYFLITDDFHVEPLVYGFGISTWTLSEAAKRVHNYINLSYVNGSCSINDTSVSSGATCAAKILLDGWKINY